MCKQAMCCGEANTPGGLSETFLPLSRAGWADRGCRICTVEAAAASGEGDAHSLGLARARGVQRGGPQPPRGTGAQKPVDHQLNVFLLAPSKGSAAFNRPARNPTSHLVPCAGTATGPCPLGRGDSTFLHGNEGGPGAEPMPGLMPNGALRQRTASGPPAPATPRRCPCPMPTEC